MHATIPEAIREAVRRDDDDAFFDLYANEDCCFAVDWREHDDEIVKLCESVLRTGRLTAEWVRADLFITFGTKRLRVPLTISAGDRHITLLALNEALAPEFEVRLLYASVGNDTHDFVPLSSDGWAELEEEAGEVVARRFHRLAAYPNTITDLVVIPKKTKARPWWSFWR